MRLCSSQSFVFVVLVEVWGVKGAPALSPTDTPTTGSKVRSISSSFLEPFLRTNKNVQERPQDLQKREESGPSTLMTVVAAVAIIIVLIGLVVGGIYFLRKHTRSKVREIELKPSVSRAGDREHDASIRSSTATTATSITEDFAPKEISTPGINLQRTGTIPTPHSSTIHRRGSRDEESSIDMSKDHLQTLRYESPSPCPSTSSVSSTAPLVSGSQHHNTQQTFTAGHKRRTSQQPKNRRLSVQTTFRTIMVEHSSGSPLSASNALEAYNNSNQGMRSPGIKSPLKSPGFYKTPRAQD